MRDCKNLLFFIILLFLSYNPVWADLLKCDVPIKDFGEIKEGETLFHAFIVKNITDSDIVVSRVLTSCGCITPLKKNLPLKAGEEVEVPIEFNSMGYGAMKLQKDIYLFVGNELNKPSLILTIMGQVEGTPPEGRVDVIPKARYIFNDLGKWHQVTVRGPASKSLQMSVRGPEWLDVKISEPQKHGELHVNQWDLEFALNRRLKNPTKGELMITTNLPLFEKLSIPVYVEPRPMLTACPPILFIKNRDPGKASVKELEITLLEDSLSEDTEPNDLRSREFVEAAKPKTEYSRINVDTDVVPILIEPSSDCIKSQLLTISPDLTKVKYEITIQDCLSSYLSLRIMVGNMSVRKVPICFLAGRHTEYK